jgi:hypothetical protein
MANIQEVCDGGPNPNTPTIEEMRASQEAGGKGTGTQEQSYAELQADFNMSTGVDVADDDVEDYPSAD